MSLSDVRDGSNQDYFYQEGFRKETSAESPESDQDYYYQEGFREETSTESPESYITREELESIYHTLLIIFYVALPVSFILLRCFTIENVPRWTCSSSSTLSPSGSGLSGSSSSGPPTCSTGQGKIGGLSEVCEKDNLISISDNCVC